jgi:hypothetical protein
MGRGRAAGGGPWTVGAPVVRAAAFCSCMKKKVAGRRRERKKKTKKWEKL